MRGITLATKKLMELLMKISKTIPYLFEISFCKSIFTIVLYSTSAEHTTLPFTSLGLVNVNIPACPDRSRPLASHTGPHRMSSL